MGKDKAGDANEKNWLIKASSKVIGPFSAIEVAQQLIKKHISIIDEVRQPRGRWTYIRETPIFSDVVQNLRSEQANSTEETASMMTNQTISRTDLVPPLPEMTPTPIINSNIDAAAHGVGPVQVKDISSTGDSKKAAQGVAVEKSFGASQDPRLLIKAKEKNRQFNMALWLMALFIGGALILFSLNRFRQPENNYQYFIEQALRYKHIHLYDKAAEFYRKAAAIREPDAETTFDLAFLMIQYDKQTLLVRRVLQQSLSDQTMSRDRRVEAFIGIALSYVLEGDLKMAQDFYEKALSYDPVNLPASINSVFNEIKKGDLPKAEALLKGITPVFNFQSHILLGRALLAAEYHKSKVNDEVIRKLTEAVTQTQPLRKELRLLLAYLYYLDQNTSQLLATLKSIVDMPMGASKDFAMDLRIDGELASWDYLERYCSEIYMQTPVSALTRAFRATCLLEQNRDGEAKRLIDEALVENPKDTYVLLSQAHYLFKNARYQETLALLKSSNLSNLKFVSSLTGKTCRALNDFICMEQNFKLAYQQNRSDVEFVADMVSVLNQSQNVTEAKILIKSGLETQPFYKPLIEFREKMENP